MRQASSSPEEAAIAFGQWAREAEVVAWRQQRRPRRPRRRRARWGGETHQCPRVKPLQLKLLQQLRRRTWPLKLVASPCPMGRKEEEEEEEEEDGWKQDDC